MKKYRLTEESIDYCGHTLHRIQALRDFGDVKVGELGGFVESEDNLSQYGDAWVANNAKVYDNAKVYGNAKVYDNAKVYGNAWVCGEAVVCGDAWVCDNASIIKNEDYIVFKNWWSSGRYFTWTRSNNMWKVGCFYGTGEELVKKAYKDSEVSGREYLRIVNYVREILGKEPLTPSTL